jgi:hypothetical protein
MNGNAFAYVLPCCSEELLKIGFSSNPVQRFTAFHPRYYELFDLDRGFLIETDKVVEARRVERELMKDIAVHNAPSPLSVRSTAGGETEWYRGAYHHVIVRGRQLAADFGYVVHTPLSDWLRDDLERQSDRLFEWSANAIGLLWSEQIDRRTDLDAQRFRNALINRADAYRAVGLSIESYVTADFFAWYSANASR